MYVQYRPCVSTEGYTTKLLRGNHFRMGGLRVEGEKRPHALFYILQICAHTNTCIGGQVLLYGEKLFSKIQ